jgi:hypothetical protein
MAKVHRSSNGIIDCRIFISQKVEAEITKSWNCTADNLHSSISQIVSREELVKAKSSSCVDNERSESGKEVDQ